jgi:chromate transporter
MAGGLFVLPGVIAIMLLSWIYALFGSVGTVSAIFVGLKAAVLAIVLEAVLRIGRRALKNRVMVGIAALAFVAIFFLRVPFPALILSAGMIGFIGGRAGLPEFQVGGGHGAAKATSNAPSLLDDDSHHATASTLRVSITSLALWLLPVIALLVVGGPDNVFSQIAVFFSKMAMVTFGGAYAVLAYVAQQAVENYGWLRPGEMLDGLGMAETTPGPLIMVLQFVGFMAAYRDAGGLSPLLAGTLGGLLATWVTFAPCFLWIFLGAPFIERMRGNKALSGALSAITAAVVGVILNLAIWFAIHTLFHEMHPLAIGPIRFDAPVPSTLNLWPAILALAAAVAIFRFRIGMIPTLGASAAAGMILYFLGVLTIPATQAAAAGALRLEAKIPLGDVRGRIDHLAVDLGRRRLYVAELANDTIALVDLRAGATSQTVAGLKEPQGVAYLPSADQLYIANGGDGSVSILKGDALSPLKKIALGSDADNIRVDPKSNRVYVGYGDGGLAVIDGASGEKISDIPLPAHPESFQLESARPRIFVNLPDAHEIVVVDRDAGKIVAHWRQTDGANFAMALDEANHLLISAFRSPPRLRQLSLADGAEKGAVQTCADVDDLFVDAKRGRLYVICGAGFIDILEARDGVFQPLDRISTVAGARTGLFVPELDRLFVAVPARVAEAAAIWVFTPS